MRTAGQLRIIAGKWRSRRLRIPRGVRSSRDFHRESLFNVIRARLADAHCLDLFAGSGALGLESLSRGARSATFLERSASVCKTLRANAASLDTDGQSRIVHTDTWRWLGRPAQRAYDVAFADPPFAEANTLAWWQLLLDKLAPHLAADAWICCEAPVQVAGIAGWTDHRTDRTGAVHWSVLARLPS